MGGRTVELQATAHTPHRRPITPCLFYADNALTYPAVALSIAGSWNSEFQVVIEKGSGLRWRSIFQLIIFSLLF